MDVTMAKTLTNTPSLQVSPASCIGHSGQPAAPEKLPRQILKTAAPHPTPLYTLHSTIRYIAHSYGGSIPN